MEYFPRVYHVMHKYFQDKDELDFEHIFEQTIGMFLVYSLVGVSCFFAIMYRCWKCT